MNAEFDHALLVGATGMLADVTRSIAARSASTTLVARHATTSGLPGAAINADWSSAAQFMDAVEPRLAEVDLAVLWVHQSGADALARLLDQLRRTHALIVQIHGSQALDFDDFSESEPFGSARRIHVVLGCVRDEHGQRWLTQAEISDGVLAAIAARKSCTIGER